MFHAVTWQEFSEELMVLKYCSISLWEDQYQEERKFRAPGHSYLSVIPSINKHVITDKCELVFRNVTL
jgi:hypothetical protein